MIRAVIVTILILGAAVWLSFSGAGYDYAGEEYISETREARKSIRPVSGGVLR